jgi:transcriptional pleiotropic regulator of transition state genes
MKSTGIVRKVDELGRLCLPKETRTVMGINEGDPLEIYVDGEKIILKKYTPGCHCCGNMENLIEVQGIPLCGGCIEQYKSAMGKLLPGKGAKAV